jgi:hypothetical protein
MHACPLEASITKSKYSKAVPLGIRSDLGRPEAPKTSTGAEALERHSAPTVAIICAAVDPGAVDGWTRSSASARTSLEDSAADRRTEQMPSREVPIGVQFKLGGTTAAVLRSSRTSASMLVPWTWVHSRSQPVSAKHDALANRQSALGARLRLDTFRPNRSGITIATPPARRRRRKTRCAASRPRRWRTASSASVGRSRGSARSSAP